VEFFVVVLWFFTCLNLVALVHCNLTQDPIYTKVLSKAKSKGDLKIRLKKPHGS